jgi:DNA-binding HxlR family transcriptional regulator
VKSYRQFCPVARALDTLGDRWTLLILRELMVRECRYSDLRDALPGIASNLLADRLAGLQDAELVERYEAPRPVSATVYRLRERGKAALPIVRELARWGQPLLTTGLGADTFRSRWLVALTTAMFDGVDTTGIAPLVVALDVGDEPVTLTVAETGVSAAPGWSEDATLTVSGSPALVTDLLAGDLQADHALTEGTLKITGSREAIRRLTRLTNPH